MLQLSESTLDLGDALGEFQILLSVFGLCALGELVGLVLVVFEATSLNILSPIPLSAFSALLYFSFSFSMVKFARFSRS